MLIIIVIVKNFLRNIVKKFTVIVSNSNHNCTALFFEHSNRKKSKVEQT